MIFDDIGSFPLPKGITREWVTQNLDSKEYEEIVQRAFLMKVNAGVECPNYPQFQDMVEQFMRIIRNYQEDAYLVIKEHAVIKELEYVAKIESDAVRVCVTGPFELYVKELGTIIYDDVLENLAKSVARFIENALKYPNVECVSIDEPSLGTNPDLQPTQEQLKLAFSHFDFDVDVQIHLHAPLYYTNILDIEEIDVIGIESAKDESVLDFVDPQDLEAYDKKLRVGIARSDIDGIIAEFNQSHNVNAWESEELAIKAIEEIESPEIIKSRIEKAYDRFGDLIAYVGPDCGLFSFPSQEVAVTLLKNVRRALDAWTT
jgi:5-methyltetrahydropteroyltriglutamate--homocysteine methyltransferase